MGTQEEQHGILTGRLSAREQELDAVRSVQMPKIIDALCNTDDVDDRQALSKRYNDFAIQCTSLSAEVAALRKRTKAAYIAVFMQRAAEAEAAVDRYNTETYKPARKVFLVAEEKCLRAHNGWRKLDSEMGRDEARKYIASTDVTKAVALSELGLVAATLQDLQKVRKRARNALAKVQSTIAEHDAQYRSIPAI